MSQALCLGRRQRHFYRAYASVAAGLDGRNGAWYIHVSTKKGNLKGLAYYTTKGKLINIFDGDCNHEVYWDNSIEILGFQELRFK